MVQRILPPEAGPVWLSQLYPTGHWQLWGFSAFQRYTLSFRQDPHKKAAGNVTMSFR